MMRVGFEPTPFPTGDFSFLFSCECVNAPFPEKIERMRFMGVNLISFLPTFYELREDFFVRNEILLLSL